MKLFSF